MFSQYMSKNASVTKNLQHRVVWQLIKRENICNSKQSEN